MLLSATPSDLVRLSPSLSLSVGIMCVAVICIRPGLVAIDTGLVAMDTGLVAMDTGHLPILCQFNTCVPANFGWS